jgi:hypothetical protein
MKNTIIKKQHNILKGKWWKIWWKSRK